MKKVGFFGGCFNPPSNIHLSIAKCLVKDNIVDEVIFVPVGDYYKKQQLEPAIDRYNMLKLSCASHKFLGVEDIASKNIDTLYAIDTFKLIYNKYSNTTDIYFIMGSDNFKKMPTWKNYQEIMQKYKFIVVERTKNEVEGNLNNIIYYKTNQKEDISSTKIREMIRKKQDVEGLIEKQTLRYIKENNLYL